MPRTMSAVREIYDGVDASGSASLLGLGLTGWVRLVRRRRDNVDFALKFVSLEMSTRDERRVRLAEARAEVAALQAVNHRAIVGIVESFEERDAVYIVLELCAGGSLFDRLDGPFEERHAARFMWEILGALQQLHRKGTVLGGCPQRSPPPRPSVEVGRAVRLNPFGMRSGLPNHRLRHADSSFAAPTEPSAAPVTSSNLSS